MHPLPFHQCIVYAQRRLFGMADQAGFCQRDSIGAFLASHLLELVPIAGEAAQRRVTANSCARDTAASGLHRAPPDSSGQLQPRKPAPA